ncbi:MAG: PIN domain-containing protein [Myxococcales bacterium]|nr:PIN domain-containing protein [Myxococcales bacterium]
MSADKVFVDTNVLVCAHNADASSKHEMAKARIAELWRAGLGVISVQVLQELYVTVTRKIPVPLPRKTARELIRNYQPWLTAPTDLDLISRATEVEELHQLSFWDALIVAAAHRAGAAVLLTEDLNDGQLIEGVRIENPFRPI